MEEKTIDTQHKFFVCKHCGNIAELINDSGVSLVCCGKKMAELKPNTVDASIEKHLPVVDISDGIVSIKIGSVSHPMEDVHHIAFIYLKTNQGCLLKCLNPGATPELAFHCLDDMPTAVYSYCNLHGLWKTEVK